MSIILYVILGLFIGYFASIFTHNQQDSGTLINVLSGFFGSLLFGVLYHIVLNVGLRSIDILGLLVSLIGGLLAVTIYFFLSKRAYL